jgi:glutathione S-transferase
MITLHDYLPSQNGWKVRVLLGLLDIPHRSRLVSIFEGESRTEAFLELNPAGAIPVLELEDGRAIAESNAILCYLAEGTRFLPGERYWRAKIMQWLFFEQYQVEPAIGSLRFWTLTGRLERNHGMVAAKRESGVRALAALERALPAGRFLAGDELSIADIAVYAYSHRAEDCGFTLASYPSVTAWGPGRRCARPRLSGPSLWRGPAFRHVRSTSQARASRASLAAEGFRSQFGIAGLHEFRVSLSNPSRDAGPSGYDRCPIGLRARRVGIGLRYPVLHSVDRPPDPGTNPGGPRGLADY